RDRRARDAGVVAPERNRGAAVVRDARLGELDRAPVVADVRVSARVLRRAARGVVEAPVGDGRVGQDGSRVRARRPGAAVGGVDALRDRLDCTIRLRGNQLTIEGDDSKVAEARAVVDELVDLVESGQEIGAGTVDTVLNALDQAEDVRTIFEDVVWSHRGNKITPKTVTQKRYVDEIRRCTVTFAI